MATLAQLQAYRDTLLDARFSGVREIKDANGETVIYKSDNELARALAAVESEILQLQKPRANTIVFATSKGI
ncbi:MAG: hypothetical protein GXP05_03640 [Alphaproteobacteria bacterium]|nr:hypothetical protein [Alphaproteobacteria bacterium]